MKKTEHIKDIGQTLLMLANEKKRQILMRFFQTNKGEYGEGNQFLGITNPQIRDVVKLAWKDTTIEEAEISPQVIE